MLFMRQGGASSSPSDGAGPSVVWPLRYVVERLFQNQRQQQQQSGKHQQPSKVRLMYRIRLSAVMSSHSPCAFPCSSWYCCSMPTLVLLRQAATTC